MNFVKINTLLTNNEIRVIGIGNLGQVSIFADNAENIITAKKTYFIQKIPIPLISHIKNEISILSNLTHANLLKFIAYHENNLEISYLRDYATYSLEEYLYILEKKTDLQKKRFAVKLLLALINFLVFLNDNKLYFLNLKPTNILLDSSENFYFTDFGCFKGKLKDNIFLAPEFENFMEKKSEEIIDFGKCDIFSLAMVILRLFEDKNWFYSEKNRIYKDKKELEDFFIRKKDKIPNIIYDLLFICSNLNKDLRPGIAKLRKMSEFRNVFLTLKPNVKKEKKKLNILEKELIEQESDILKLRNIMKNKDRNIEEATEYILALEKKNYNLTLSTIIQNSEISILTNELKLIKIDNQNLEQQQKVNIIKNKENINTIINDSINNTFSLLKEINKDKIYNSNEFPLIDRLKGHLSYINCLENFENPNDFHPCLSSGANDNKIIIWDLFTMKIKSELNDHKAAINSLTYTENFDFPCMLSASDDATVKIWDINDFSCVNTIFGPNSQIRIAIMRPNSQDIIMAGSDKIINIWDYKQRKFKYNYKGHSQTIWSLIWAQDFLVSAGSDCNIILWDFEKKESFLNFKEHQADIFTLTYLQDKNLLISGSRDQTIRFLDIRAKKSVEIIFVGKGEIWNLKQSNSNNNILFSLNGSNTVDLWDIRRYENIVNIEAEKGKSFGGLQILKNLNTIVWGSNKSLELRFSNNYL